MNHPTIIFVDRLWIEGKKDETIQNRHAAETAVGRAGIGHIDAIERIRVFFFFAQLPEPVPMQRVLSKQDVVDNNGRPHGFRRGRNVVVVGPAETSGGNSRRHRPE
jgi:hypothetical protein